MTDDTLISFFAALLALATVLVLAYLAIRGGAKITRFHQKNGLIKVLEVTSLGGRDRLVVVDYNHSKILLGVSNHGVQVLNTEVEPAKTARPVAQTITGAQ